MGFEIALADGIGHATEREVAVHPGACLGQGLGVDISRHQLEQLGRAVAVLLQQGHGQGVRLLARGAPGRQDAHGRTPGMARQRARRQALYQQFDLLGLAEKIGFVDGEQVHQRLELGATAHQLLVVGHGRHAQVRAALLQRLRQLGLAVALALQPAALLDQGLERGQVQGVHAALPARRCGGRLASSRMAGASAASGSTCTAAPRSMATRFMP